MASLLQRRRRYRQRVKARLHRQAQAAVAPAANRQIRMLRSRLGDIRQQASQERQSIRGAISAAESAISQTSLKGLHGLPRRQLARELASRRADVAQSLPYLTAEANAAARQDLASAREDIVQARIDKASGIQSAYQSGLDEARNAIGIIPAPDRLRPSAAAGAQGGEGGRTPQEIRQARQDRRVEQRTAAAALHDLMSSLEPGKRPWEAPNPDAAWAALIQEVNGVEGVSYLAARQAVHDLQKRLANPYSRNPTTINAILGGAGVRRATRAAGR